MQYKLLTRVSYNKFSIQNSIVWSRQSLSLVLGCRQAGKAQDFDSCIRWFESSHPSQYIGH